MPGGAGDGLRSVPVEFRGVDPARLSVTELREMHDALGDWIDEAQSAESPPESLIDEAHEALVRIAAERARRQRD